MRKLILTLALCIATLVGTQAQTKGDWYVGTGDIANTAWTDWAVSPTVGYGVTDNLMIGLSIAQADSTVDLETNFHARYYMNGYFAYMATSGLNTDAMSVGVGKMFMIRNNVYVDPKVVYNTGDKTTNLTLGFGLKF
ncbi:MAG: hypothetical protein H8E55_57495 [Pelagibacterales bacterium]|nr:hypothetical protein [Pelagibacterales bacterium]